MDNEGGFLLKFNGKEALRCHSVAFDYDNWQYTLNNVETRDLPDDLESAAVVVEHPE